MIHLFDSPIETLEKKRREQIVTRLTEVADLRLAMEIPMAAGDEPLFMEQMQPEPAATLPEVLEPALPPIEADAKPESVPEPAPPLLMTEPDQGGPDEIQELAGRMAQELAGALQRVHQLAVRDGSRPSTEVAELVEAVRKLGGEIAALREQTAGLEKRLQDVDTSTRSQQERVDRQSIAAVTRMAQLSARVEGLDRSLQTQAGGATDLRSVLAQIQERNLAVEKRLDSQAAAIRQLHASAQDREDRLSKLRAGLEDLEQRVARPAVTPVLGDL